MHHPTRAAILALALAATLTPAAVAAPTVGARLAELERNAGGRLGVAALGAVAASFRAQERFPFCSTFKVMVAGAVLKRGETDRGLLGRRIPYTKADLVPYSPVTAKYTGKGMTVAELCAAAIQYSDNTAANLLIRLVGDPGAVTRFASDIGDSAFRLDRWEPELNEWAPGEQRDTTTPAAMAASVKRLVLGDVLTKPSRDRLATWMRGSTTGDERIRAGVPAGWKVGDKTGTGDFGTTNDVAVIWPKGRPPVVLAIYYTQAMKGAKSRSDVLADATRIVLSAIAPARSK
jgi:beta-lactamase class A